MSKVRVTFTLDVDLAVWRMEYGVKRGEERADINTYFHDAAVEHIHQLGLAPLPTDIDEPR